jgi:NAD(P)-dependent dehydrogenase (short-subunit alcohol dehydrogenase family)
MPAGVMFMKPVSATTEADFDRIFAINLKGVFFAINLQKNLRGKGRRVPSGVAMIRNNGKSLRCPFRKS